jgi:hypothetical protein
MIANCAFAIRAAAFSILFAPGSRGPDPHRVAGEALNDMGIEPGGVSSAFDDTIDRVGMQGVRAYAVARDSAEQLIVLDRSSIEPRVEDSFYLARA